MLTGFTRAAVTIQKGSDSERAEPLKNRPSLPKLPHLSIFVRPSLWIIIVAMRVIDLPPPWTDAGLSFGEFFHRKELVGSALLKLIAQLPAPTVSYCLKFCADQDHGTESWFEPYERSGLVTTNPVSSAVINLPEKVPFLRILPDTWTWPVLGLPTPSARDTPAMLRDAAWRAAVRLEVTNSDDRYVGYFKIVGMYGSRMSVDDLVAAHMSAKTWLDLRVNELRRATQLFAQEVCATRTSVQSELGRNRPRHALMHFVRLLTAHLGADVNRAAVFVPVAENSLECVYAHGWCDSAISNEIRGLVAHGALTISELHSQFGNELPTSDPLYQDVVGERVGFASSSLISDVWRNRNILTGLPEGRTIQIPSPDQIGETGVVISTRDSRTIAAFLDATDAWLKDHQIRRPNSTVFKTQKMQWFLIPWRSKDRPLGVIICDMASWGRWDLLADIIPRLKKASEIIDHFAADFSGVNSWQEAAS